MKEVIKKYQVFIKYIMVAILSFIIDICLFHLFNNLILNIIYATIMARVISSIFNFLMNKNKVFQSKNKYTSEFIKYILLVIIQMFLSAFLVDTLAKFILINPTIIKIPVDFIIFIVNYLVQKFLIFH